MPAKKPESSNVTVGNMTNSIIQQNSDGASASLNASQTQSVNDSASELLNQVVELLKSLGVSADDKAELEHEIATIKSELAAKKPKTGIFKLCFEAIRDKLIAFGSTAIAGQVIAKAQPVIDSINYFLQST